MDERAKDSFKSRPSTRAAVPGMLILVSHLAIAGDTLPVTNCLDDGSAGSLRSVVAAAASGDTVDLRGLGCPVIQLTGGEIIVAHDDLSLTGPGSSTLAIDPQASSRVFHHSGTGTLAITALTVRNGSVISASLGEGGCIRSAGSVALDHAAVSSCAATGASTAATTTRATTTKGWTPPPPRP